jgi:NAD-dependent deacetylase
VLTGAGVSAESGIPTFRDQLTGLWERYDAAELATDHAFDRDAALVWGWYEWRRMLVLKAQPNRAHGAIAAMAERIPAFTLATQNVDDLHERAGSRSLLHLHGTLASPRCERCETPYHHPQGIPDLPPGGMRIDPPRCSGCGARVRPGVVWFGESLPQREWTQAVQAASHCDVFISVGTSSLVQPAASLVECARRRGGLAVQVNPNLTRAEASFNGVLQGPAGVILPRLVRDVWGVTPA